MSDEHKLLIASISEKLGAIDKTATAAHNRIDNLQILMREDFKSMSDNIQKVDADIKVLLGFMNRSQGWAAAALFAGGIIGWLVTKAFDV